MQVSNKLVCPKCSKEMFIKERKGILDSTNIPGERSLREVQSIQCSHCGYSSVLTAATMSSHPGKQLLID